MILHLPAAVVLFDVIGTPKPQGSMKACIALFAHEERCRG